MSFDSYPKPYELVKAGTVDEQTLIQSMLPQFDDKRKVDYLVLRSVNFLSHEALAAVDVTQEVYAFWCATDETFVDFESKRLRFIQGHVGREVLRAAFMRNVYLQLGIDTEVLRQRAFDKGSMSNEDRKDAREAGMRYSAGNIAQMVKVLGGEEGGGGTDSAKPTSYDLYVPLDASAADEVLIRRASAKALLGQFSKDKNHDGAVEGEVVSRA